MSLTVDLIPGLGAVAVFSWLAVAVWSDNRRREREAYYKSEALRKLAEMEGGAASVLEYMRGEEKNAARRLREGRKLGGAVAVAAGIGLLVSLLAIRPDSSVYFVGLIPMLVGAALLVYVYVLAPKE